MKRTIAFILLLFAINFAFAQSPTCDEASPFCTGIINNFPASTNTSAEIGPDYDCVLSQPNPAWFYLEIDDPGDLTIEIQSTPGMYDLDFVCWGPLASLATACSNLTSANVADCSYSTSDVETCNIVGANAGEIYILMVTNFSNQATNIQISQTGGSASTICGSSTNCGIFSVNFRLENCDTVTGNIELVSYLGFLGIEPTDTVIVFDNTASISVMETGIFTSSHTMVLPDIPTDGQLHEIIVYMISSDTTCQDTLYVELPLGCPECTASAGPDIELCGFPVDEICGTYGVNDIAGYWMESYPNFEFSDPDTSCTFINTNEPGVYDLVWVTYADYPYYCYDTVNLNLLPAPTISLLDYTPETTSGSCDGEINILVGGGTTPYTYNWSDGQTTQTAFSLCEDNYTVTVTGANSCTDTFSMYLPTCETLSTELPDEVTGCGSSSVILDPGVFDTYSWSNGYTWQVISVNTPGWYYVTVTLGACTAIDSVEVIYYPNPALELGPDITICETDSVLLDAGVFESYEWSTGSTEQTIYATGMNYYEVTVYDENSCSSTDGVMVFVDEVPEFELGGDTAICAYDQIILSTEPGYDSYLWHDGNTGYATIVDSAGVGLSSIDCWVVVENGDCVATDSITVSFVICSDINDASIKNSIVIYPNPTTGKVYFDKASKVQVYDPLGKMIIEEKNADYIDLTGFAKGIYLVKLYTDNKSEAILRKIVKE